MQTLKTTAIHTEFSTQVSHYSLQVTIINNHFKNKKQKLNHLKVHQLITSYESKFTKKKYKDSTLRIKNIYYQQPEYSWIENLF